MLRALVRHSQRAAMSAPGHGGRAFSRVPVIDLSAYTPGGGSDVVQELRRACCEVGTFYVAGHGVAPELQRALTDHSRRFFAEPAEHKNTFAFVNSPHWRGYNGLAQETTAGRKDMREQLEFGLEMPAEKWTTSDPPHMRLHGPNQWPTLATDNGDWGSTYRSVVQQYVTELRALSEKLTSALAEALDMPADHFRRFFEPEPHIRMKVVQYPPRGSVPDPDGFGVGPHKDYGFFGFLLQDDVGGLQVQNSDGVWLDVTPLDNTFVVSLGEMLEVATAGAFTATTHRVLVPQSTRARLSVNYFYCPAPAATMEAVPLTEKLLDARARWSASTFDGSENNQIFENYGFNALKGMLRSHMDVARAHHQDLLYLVDQKK